MKKGRGECERERERREEERVWSSNNRTANGWSGD
ncbi:unnamed protein product [Musa acuminata subsp. malaccensis]|uniref:(wild Malaysian banana) hypothetical protein n=1 Tax=Musa acuminata subsp. malaccensis TaxID=214687 RepID=A0A804KQL8_MUSAM|nr:unnamed protein product [Musa acuminata subsp. malaccensis]